MKILDFTNDPLTTMTFTRETLFAMCYVPKVIAFETAEEIWKFKAVCEVHLAEPLEDMGDEEIIDDYYASDVCRWFVDTLEEEAWMLKVSRDPNDEYYKDYSGRTLILTSDISETNLDDSVNLSTNKTRDDMNMPMEYFEVFNREITKLLASDMTEKLKEDTQEMFRKINKVFSEDIEAWKSGTAKHFQRDIKEIR
jgi:hypothetical protein